MEGLRLLCRWPRYKHVVAMRPAPEHSHGREMGFCSERSRSDPGRNNPVKNESGALGGWEKKRGAENGIISA